MSSSAKKRKAQWSVSRLLLAAKGKDLAATVARESLEQLKEDIKLARRFFHGYESIDGFNLRYLQNIPSRQLGTMRRRLREIQPTLASHYTTVRPRSDSARKALAKMADRPITRAAKQVPIGVAPDTAVKIETRGKRSTVRLERKLTTGATWNEQTWYFKDYRERKDRSLDTEEGVGIAYERMIESGDMYPDGFYVLVTGAYGNVGSPATMYGMQDEMMTLFIKYEKEPGKVKEFIGVRLVGFDDQTALNEYDARERARMARKVDRQRLERQRRYRVSQRAKYFCPSCRAPYRGKLLWILKCKKCGHSWQR